MVNCKFLLFGVKYFGRWMIEVLLRKLNVYLSEKIKGLF